MNWLLSWLALYSDTHRWETYEDLQLELCAHCESHLEATLFFKSIFLGSERLSSSPLSLCLGGAF